MYWFRNPTIPGLCLGIALVLTVGCSTRPPKDTDIVATWDDTALTVAQFKDLMKIRYSTETASKNRPLEDRFNILNEYITRDCKLLEGRRLGYAERADIVKQMKDMMESTAADLLYDLKVRDRVITEDILRDFYEKSAVEVRAQHVLIKVDPKVTGKDTLQYWQRANDVYQQATSGADFNRLVDRYSEDDTIDPQLHGDLGYFYWGKMVDEFEQTAWKLKPGEISPPVRSRYGYHVIKVLDRRSAGLEVNTSHILVNCSRRASPAETTLAYERAMTILKEAQRKGADFAQLARKYSEDRRTWVNGEVGWVARGTMPTEYWELAFTIPPGQVGGPVRTYKGYHIIKVHEKRDNVPPLTDEEYRNRLLARLSRVYADTIQALSQKFVADMKRDFGMKYNPEVVKMLLRKLGDKEVPKNMNPFSALTPEDRELYVVTDNLGGLKVQDLVDRYGDHRVPLAFRNEDAYIHELAEGILTPRYLAELARREGLMQHPKVLEDGKRALENAIMPEIEREMVFNKAVPTEQQVREYYDKNLKKYTEAATATVYEVQVDDQKQAKEILDRINQGEDISKLARRYTVRTSTRNKGGRLGPFAIDQYGEISRKAFTLQPGEVAGPIAEEGKYSVIKLIERTPERVKPYEEVRSQVESDAKIDMQNRLKEAWENELRRAYKMKINKAMVKRVWPVVVPLTKEQEKERKSWEDQREELAKKKEAESQIRLKLKPGTEQEFTTKEGKRVKVNIGQPQYRDKEGNPIPPEKAKIKLTPKGTLEGKEQSGQGAPKLRITPKVSNPEPAGTGDQSKTK